MISKKRGDKPSTFSSWKKPPPKPSKFSAHSRPDTPQPTEQRLFSKAATAIQTQDSTSARAHSASPQARRADADQPRRALPARPPLTTTVLSPGHRIQVSAVLSIHNRSRLFQRALDGYLWQTIPRDRWEIVLVDDMSSVDLAQAYSHLIGRLNLRHVKIDHTRHPIYSEMSALGPGPDGRMRWYHTPAISLNIGFALAAGQVLCVCHPEILHAPTNFERAVATLRRSNEYLFGTTYLGTQATNRMLEVSPDWTSLGWPGFLDASGAVSLQSYGYECYWYTSFLPRAAAVAVGGVDLAYMKGVAGEDDDFRERVKRAGWDAIHMPEIEGFHQDHSDEVEPHRRRDTEAWDDGLRRNRAIYQARKLSGNWPFPANGGTDWSCLDCVVEEVRWTVGSRVPERIPGKAAAIRA